MLWLCLFLVFLAVWISMLGGISFLGGWGRLARHYRAAGPTPRGLAWQTLVLDRGIAFRGSVSAAADDRGVYFQVWPIYRAFHPPLMIPWEDLRSQRQGPSNRWGRLLVARQVRLCARLAPDVPLVVSERLAETLCAATGASWLCPA
jgi:hypothetical protein